MSDSKLPSLSPLGGTAQPPAQIGTNQWVIASGGAREEPSASGQREGQECHISQGGRRESVRCTARPTTTTTTSASTSTTTGKSTVTVQKDLALEKAQRQRDRLNLQNPAVLRERALQGKALFQALRSDDPRAMSKALKKLPTGVSLIEYLPELHPDDFLWDDDTASKRYKKSDGADAKLNEYFKWCRDHSWFAFAQEHMSFNGPKAERDEAMPLMVLSLCDKLKHLDHTYPPESLKARAQALEKMMSDPDISAHELARQNLASTRMMLEKCTLLSPYIDAETLHQFETLVCEAHALREGAAVALQAEHLKKPLDENKVVIFSTYVNGLALTRPSTRVQLAPTPPETAQALEAWTNDALARTAKPLNKLDRWALENVLFLVKKAQVARDQ